MAKNQTKNEKFPTRQEFLLNSVLLTSGLAVTP